MVLRPGTDQFATMRIQEMTKVDFMTVGIVGIILSASIWLFWQYVLLPTPSDEHCWYEIKYLHVSGQDRIKKVYCDCDGFNHWHQGSKYKIEMEVPFANGKSVKIQGATDILSVQKIEE